MANSRKNQSTGGASGQSETAPHQLEELEIPGSTPGGRRVPHGDSVRQLSDRSMVFQVAYLRYLNGGQGSRVRLEAFRAGWAAHDKARGGTRRPMWAKRSVPTQSVTVTASPIEGLVL